MEKLLTFIIKDISVSRDIYTVLRNHKLLFCNYVTTVLKILCFNWLFLQLTSPQVEGNCVKWGIFVSFSDSFKKSKKIEIITGECFSFTKGDKWRRNAQLSLRLSFMGTMIVKFISNSEKYIQLHLPLQFESHIRDTSLQY